LNDIVEVNFSKRCRSSFGHLEANVNWIGLQFDVWDWRRMAVATQRIRRKANPQFE
jgi:hypothetical protein